MHMDQEASLRAEHAPPATAAAEAAEASPARSGNHPAVRSAVQRAAAGPLPTVQLFANGAVDTDRVQQAAEAGIQGGGGALPHLDSIQRSFGHHDVTGVKGHDNVQAKAANQDMNAEAYATRQGGGEHIAFKNSPDLHTAAHEAAHIVQQRAGVQLDGGVGQTGDAHEQHADRVADAVVAGQSAAPLLDGYKGAGGGGVQAKPVQLLGDRLDKALPASAQTPGVGSLNPTNHNPEDPNYRGATSQRRYTVDQYIEMWEAERGRKMTEAEKATLARGCIGITALNIEAVNPPLDHAYGTFDQAMAVVKEWNAFIEKHKGEHTADGRLIGDYKAYLFAKLFWSNQRDWDPNKSEDENRKLSATPDDKAFKPDAKTGRVDMSTYKYQGQPNLSDGGWYVNFDYGFWDEDSQCFWHANHSMPGMKVYQSTKEKFTKGYIDFDRIVFCAAIAKKYNPAAAAERHG